MLRSVLARPVILIAVLSGMALSGCMSRPDRSYFSNYESMLRQDGLLRTETAPADAPYTHADVARNFERIALRDEANASVAGSDSNSVPTALRRWEGSLRYRIDGSAANGADRTEIARLMGRIAALTGLEITESADDPNFRILLVAPIDHERIGADLARTSPRFAMAFKYWQTNARVVCIADREYDAANGDVVARAIAVIGSETTGLLRRSCLHEEIVQALGLSNDHSGVRPSVFNDDAEFALLTKHDEALLRILYDDRLAPGMNAVEAMPIVRMIAREVVPQE